MLGGGQHGNTVLLLGPSGAGKTTLFTQVSGCPQPVTHISLRLAPGRADERRNVEMLDRVCWGGVQRGVPRPLIPLWLVLWQLREGSVLNGTVTSMEENVDTFPLHTEKASPCMPSLPAT